MVSNLAPPAGLWIPYALSLIEAIVIAALYLRPVLETRRIAVASRSFAIAAALGWPTRLVDAASGMRRPRSELMITFGAVAFAFVLIYVDGDFDRRTPAEAAPRHVQRAHA